MSSETARRSESHRSGRVVPERSRMGHCPGMLDPDLFAFIGVAFIVVITPGPDMVLVTTHALSKGKSSARVAALGICAGILVHATAAVIGLSALLATSSVAFVIVKVAGAAFLIGLGVRTIWNARRAAVERAAEPGPGTIAPTPKGASWVRLGSTKGPATERRTGQHQSPNRGGPTRHRSASGRPLRVLVRLRARRPLDGRSGSFERRARSGTPRRRPSRSRRRRRRSRAAPRARSPPRSRAPGCPRRCRRPPLEPRTCLFERAWVVTSTMSGPGLITTMNATPMNANRSELSMPGQCPILLRSGTTRPER